MSVVVNTSGRIYDDFVRLFFLHVFRETSDLTGELQFRFLHSAYFPSTCLRGLSYISLVSFTLVDHPLFLLLSESYFLNDLSESHMICVHI